MPQAPRGQSSRSLRAGRTNPALPGAMLSTTPVYVPASQRQRWPQLPAGRRASTLRRVSTWLLLVGFLLGLCFLLLYPLPGIAFPGSFAAQALPLAFSWLPHLFWTRQFPGLLSFVSQVSWLNLRSGSPVAAVTLFLLLLGGTGVLLILAVRAGQRAVHDRLQKGPMRLLLLLICLFTLLFGVLFVFLPGGISQGALLSGLDGRLILVYHVNPYLAGSNLFFHDPLYHVLLPGSFASPLSGPLWLDLTVPVAWLMQGNPVNVLLGFRAAGLGLHLLNALLIWGILAALKPETRLTGTLLYAWNPAILLLGVSEMQADLAVIFCLLVGVFFLQRRSLLLGWICFLLAALINPFCLLLLPLFLRVLARETRGQARGGHIFWWLMLFLFTALIVVLAYAPYWSGLGIDGIALRLRDVFWQSTAQHSLLAALSKLPFATWPPAAWLLTPHHWLILPALIVGGLLVLGIWITDNLELALLFGGWIFLALVILLPINMPWLILLPLVLSLASSSQRTTLLAHLLTAGSLLAYGLAYWPDSWSGQALVTIGLPVLVWGWTLFFLSTWRMTHHEDEGNEPRVRTRLSISRPSWPSRPAAWPSRYGQRRP